MEEDVVFTVIPEGDDRQPVMQEVLGYWRQRLLMEGSVVGLSAPCSSSFKAGEESSNISETIPAEFIDESIKIVDYSDYEEHRILMDAGVPQLRMLLAMLRARGIKVKGTE